MTDGNLAALKRLYDRWAVGDWTCRGRRAIRFDVFDHESDALDAAGLADDSAA